MRVHTPVIKKPVGLECELIIRALGPGGAILMWSPKKRIQDLGLSKLSLIKIVFFAVNQVKARTLRGALALQMHLGRVWSGRK